MTVPAPIDRRRRLASLAVALAPSARRFGAVSALAAAVPSAAFAAPDRRRLDALADEARGLERLHALVVMHDGDVVLSEAFRGPPPTRAVNVKSVSKSIVAALVGCALQRGVVDEVEATLGALAPALLPEAADPRVRTLSLGSLLSMRAGLERTSGGAYGRWVSSDDWVRHALTRPFVDVPDGRMLYSTGNYHVLGAILASLTGSDLYRLARRWLGEPLDIDFAPWTRDPQGRYLGGNEMSLSPLDMARFGELYRLGGEWNGTRVFPERWAGESFTPRSISPWSDDGYGYGWFLRAMGDTSAAYARGYGGQLVHVLPTERLVVAITSDTTRSARGDGYVERLHGLVERHLAVSA